jgi:hypothetical protein
MLAPAAAAVLAAALLASAPRGNAVLVEQSATLPRPGFGLAYERAFLRHLSVSGGLEHQLSPRSYTHLPGFEERLGFGLWVLQPLSGPYVQATFGLAQNVFYRDPRHARHAVRLGADVGYRFAIGRHWLVGVTIGARYTLPLTERSTICRRDFQCPSTAEGLAARFGIHVGWRFGDA